MRRPVACGVAAAILLVAPATAQMEDPPPVAIPQLAATSAGIEGFVPAGWKLEAKAEGDLDGDSKPDAVLVLHQQDPKNIIRNEGLGPDKLDTNPRILAVAVAAEGGYRLVAQNATLIPRHTEPNMEDPFGEDGAVAIARGAVKVTIHSFATAGGWETSNVDFTFKVRGGTLELIGYDNFTLKRNSGETTTTSVNYASGKMSVASGTIESDDAKTVWSKLPVKRGPTIDELGNGFEFDPKAKRR